VKQANKRKTFLINKPFQLKFILYTLLPTLVIQLLLWLVLGIYLDKMMDKGVAANLPPDHFYFRLISEQLSLMKILFLSVGIISFVVVIVWALFISHKIAGPFHRLTRMLETDDPNLKSLKFRPGDFFPEVAEALAKYLNSKE